MVITILTSFTLIAQPATQISSSDLSAINFRVEQNAGELIKKLSIENVSTLEIEFTVDTFKIERIFDEKMKIENSTLEMNIALMSVEKDYDGMLNKYYQKLKSNLTTADQEILKKSQLNWLKFRDSEKDIYRILRKEEYTGGGTIRGTIYLIQSLELTKKRVIQLYDELLYLKTAMN